MSVNTALERLQTISRGLTGIKFAPDSVPESIAVYPFSIAYEREGALALRSSGWANNYAILYVEFHVSRVLLPKSITTAAALRDPFLQALIADPTLAGAVQSITEIKYTFGGLRWAGVDTIGYRFEITVKVSL